MYLHLEKLKLSVQKVRLELTKCIQSLRESLWRMYGNSAWNIEGEDEGGYSIPEEIAEGLKKATEEGRHLYAPIDIRFGDEIAEGIRIGKIIEDKDERDKIRN